MFSREDNLNDTGTGIGVATCNTSEDVMIMSHLGLVKMGILLLFKITNDLIDVPAEQLHPSSNRTRGHDMIFRQISAKQNYYRHSFVPTNNLTLE